ncbi:AMP-binding protein [Ligilactobacillus murinus]|uniref:AMP-binding protein n=1 Tax=Ligilactobacillus murinus TaxID=1622 RepID=UPI001F04297F|nr:AMP-binding protein [Ligilactobacillus murinus]
MCKNYIYLLEVALNAPEERIYEIGLTTNKFSKPQSKYKVTKNIVEYFQEQVVKNPNKIAVEANDRNFTYSELDSMSNKIANFLLNSGIETKSKIGVFLHRDSRVIASILGILKTGSAYVPIDTSYPKKRIDYILKDAGVKNVITVEELSDQLPKSIKKVLLDGDSFFFFFYCQNPRIDFDECDLAYVIYTSGSTGNPKGVMVKNKNITRLILSAREVFDC